MTDVLIVGAGLAGLSCACELHNQGLSCLLIESSDAVGGRARTDLVDGFLLDRGFQVLLTAYPEAQRQLDYPSLQLRSFEPGALVRFGGRFHRIADPWRKPSGVFSTLVSPIGTLADKLKLASLRSRLTRGASDTPTEFPETSTIQLLGNYGFSPAMIERFFRPFLGGIFLEQELATSSRMFEFVFRMFSLGEAALPSSGMGAMAQQLASRLPADCIRLQQEVAQVAPSTVTLASGEEIQARMVVIATDNNSAARLLSDVAPATSRGTTCFYFATDKPPIAEPVLVLNGEGQDQGPINNLCVPSVVAPTYAPEGKHLVSATVVGDRGQSPSQLLGSVRGHLAEWFGGQVQSWQHLHSYWIPDALPQQPPASGAERRNNPVLPGLYLCGDYQDTASINGALASGRTTARAVVADLDNDKRRA